MTSDLQALLAAIVADPSDDVARLVYADCLEEHGNAARAAFVRLQIEAERHHPDSPARAELEHRAHALFAEHWVDWWGAVCAATGLLAPAPKPSGRLGKMARWVGLGTPPGTPYAVNPGSFWVVQTTLRAEPVNQGFVSANFWRGFPDSVLLSWQTNCRPDRLLRGWPSVAPIAHLRMSQPFGADWPAGPHLRGIRSLHLSGSCASDVLNLLTGPNAPAVEELTLMPYFDDAGEADAFADVLVALLNSPAAARLKSFHVQAQTVDAIAALAQAPQIASLSALGLDLTARLGPWIPVEDRLAILARSPHLSGLRELTVVGAVGGSLIDPSLKIGSKWPELRKLTLGLGDHYCDSLDAVELSMALEVLLSGDHFPALEELRVTGGVLLDRQVTDALVRSPLLKRLKHFALAVHGYDVAEVNCLRRLAQVVDLDRIETFALRCAGKFAAEAELRKHLGNRLRMIRW